MKYILLLVIFIMLFKTGAHCQTSARINFTFDDTAYKKNIYIPQNLHHCKNIWQVGKPNKKVFDSAYSKPNAMVTDTVKTYPPNDTSEFIFNSLGGIGVYVNYPFRLYGKYKVNTDSLKAYGRIEFSPDNGRHWFDFLNDTSLKKFTSYTGHAKPILTGNSNGWQSFDMSISFSWDDSICSKYRRYFSDTSLWRFTFISDSTHSTKDGLMFDNLLIMYYDEGINEIPYTQLPSTSTPNPAHDALTITYDNKNSTPFTFKLCDATGRVVQYKDAVKTNKLDIDLHALPAGIYYYSLTNRTFKLQSSGKFVKE